MCRKKVSTHNMKRPKGDKNEEQEEQQESDKKKADLQKIEVYGEDGQIVVLRTLSL